MLATIAIVLGIVGALLGLGWYAKQPNQNGLVSGCGCFLFFFAGVVIVLVLFGNVIFAWIGL